MDDFDPIPPVNPMFKGLVVASLIILVTLVLLTLCLFAVDVLT